MLIPMRGIREGWTKHPWEWLLLLAAAALLGTLLLAPRAHGAFHEIKIREISGETIAGDDAYIELQLYAAGSNQVSGHKITLWDADAFNVGVNPVVEFTLSGTNPPNGESQRTILIGDSNVFAPDFTVDLTPYLDPGAGASLVPAGAACFEAIPVDCVSWGGPAFTGAANLPDDATPYGQPLPVTFALRRDISAGCATLLEASDDTNANGADFVAAVPRDPTPNGTVPIETPCTGPPQPVKCGGLNVTGKGTAGANVLRGTPGRDVIAGLGGNDTIRGLGGNDVLCGGGGRDQLIGGGGRDRLLGQAGRDTCKGGPKRDTARTCEVKRTI
jgi:hypothetical protein